MAKTVKSYDFTVPELIASDIKGYEFLSRLNLALWHTHDETIKLTFSENSYFEANLFSPLGALLDNLKARSNKVVFIGLKDIMARGLSSKNG